MMEKKKKPHLCSRTGHILMDDESCISENTESELHSKKRDTFNSSSSDDEDNKLNKRNMMIRNNRRKAIIRVDSFGNQQQVNSNLVQNDARKFFTNELAKRRQIFNNTNIRKMKRVQQIQLNKEVEEMISKQYIMD